MKRLSPLAAGDATSDSLRRLREQRDYECRLTADRALESFDDAVLFLADRGLLTRTADSNLPSLFEACHEESHQPGSRSGFGSWPRTKWAWAGELEARPDVTVLKVHHSKNLMLSRSVLELADPICRAELERFTSPPAGLLTREARNTTRLLDYLTEVGPAPIEEVRADLGLSAPELKQLRYPLERCGALVGRQVISVATEGHLHSTVLYRYDQLVERPLRSGSVTEAFDDLLVAGMRAAVLAEERQLRRWFSWNWYFSPSTVDRLVDSGRVIRPAAGLVALGGERP